MGCFVSCFRSRDQDRKVQLRPRAPSNSDSCYDLESLEERLVVENQLGTLFLNREKDIEEDLGQHCTLDEELRKEAKHLKLCGAIPETPMEIRKLNKRIAFQELNGSDQSKSAQTSSNKKIHLGVQCDQENSPEKAITATPGSGKENSTSRQNTPETGSSEEMRGRKLDLTPVKHLMGIRVSGPNSPYPTPITLNGEMQTPATIYASSYKETPVTGQRAPHIRTQYVYPEMEISSCVESVEKMEKEMEVVTTGDEFSFRTKKSCMETPKVVGSSSGFSQWLKPVTALKGSSNGIPNTTTKYKEDQQVKWHATPFEERLERVLSHEKPPSPRNLTIRRLIELEE